MVFLCHYRNKLIFGGGGDSLELEQHDVSGDVSRGMAQWQTNSEPGGCQSAGYLNWCSPCYRRWESGITQKQPGARVTGQNESCWDMDGVSRGRGQLWHWLGETLTKWEGHLGSSCLWSPSLTMRVAFLALRLMCLAWLWPVTQLNSSHFPNKRRNKELYVGENARQKHGGWAKVAFLRWIFDLL